MDVQCPPYIVLICPDLRSGVDKSGIERRPRYLNDLFQPGLKSGAFLYDFLGLVALTLGSAGLEVRLAGSV